MSMTSRFGTPCSTLPSAPTSKSASPRPVVCPLNIKLPPDRACDVCDDFQ